MEPYRGDFGGRRPPRLAALPLPPAPMPARHGLRPLKAWRYVLVIADELMLCAAQVRVGPARRAFWALWDREARRLSEGARGVTLGSGRVRVRGVAELSLEEAPGVETVCPAGAAYAWTRKQGDVPVRGRVRGRALEGRAIVDDTAAYYPRHTSWRWSAGVGRTTGGQAAAWNLVAGVNDPPENSERTVWLDGVPHEVPGQAFAPDLSAVGGLRFHAEAVREHDENRLLVRSRYRQPFGTFTGVLPGGLVLAAGLGVMEEHDAAW